MKVNKDKKTKKGYVGNYGADIIVTDKKQKVEPTKILTIDSDKHFEDNFPSLKGKEEAIMSGSFRERWVMFTNQKFSNKSNSKGTVSKVYKDITIQENCLDKKKVREIIKQHLFTPTGYFDDEGYPIKQKIITSVELMMKELGL